MTNAEAIRTLRLMLSQVEWDYPMEYSAAIDIAIEALQKQIPKKPVMGYAFTEKMREVIKRTDPERAESITECCPVCRRTLGVSQFVKAQTGLRVGNSYCKWCGQAIDWEEE